MTLKIKGCYTLCVIALFFIPNIVSNLQAANNSFYSSGSELFKRELNNQNNYNSFSSVFQDSSSLISVSPFSVTCWSGCSVVFTVETIGLVDSYHWEVSSDNGNIWDFTGISESNLSLVEVSDAMNQNLYRCRVSKGGIEEVSLAARLTVIEAPEVNAGPDQSICVNGAQNRLAVALQGSTTASSFVWEVINGEGQFLDEETLSPSYIVNPKDAGKEVVFSLSVTENGGGCVLTDEMRLTVREAPLFDVLLDVDGQNVPFDDAIGSFGLTKSFEAVSIRYDVNNPEIQHQNFKEDNLLLNKSIGASNISRALFNFNLHDLPLGTDLLWAGIVIVTTQAGGIGENGKDALELYRVLGDWESENVTWANQPAVDTVKIIPSDFIEREYELPDCEGENCKQIRKRYTFLLTDLASDWYSGDMPNRGFLLKLADETDINTEFIVERAYNSVTKFDYVSLGAHAGLIKVLYLCKDKSVDVEPVSSTGESLSYDWNGGVGLDSKDDGTASIASHEATESLTTFRSYTLKGSLNDCSSSLRFFTAPTPLVTMPISPMITGSLTQQVSYTVAATASNRPGLINWRKINGDGTIINNDRIQSMYQAEIADYGKTIELEVTVYSEKDCTPEVRTTSLHIFRPLHPYGGGSPFYACSGQSIKLDKARLANVPGVSNPDEQPLLDSIAEGYVTSYYWTHNGQGSFDDANLLNPTYSPPANGIDNNIVTCTLHVTDGDAKRVADVTSDVQIHYIPLPVIVPGSYEAVHVGDSIVFDKTIISHAIGQEWLHNGNGVFTYNPGEVPSYIPHISDLSNENQEVIFSVKVWNQNECDIVEENVVLSVLPPANVSAGEDLNICLGDEVELEAQGGSQYLWSPETGLSDSHIANPLASPTNTTVYTVIIIGEHEGVEYTTTDQVLVTVSPLPEANAGVDRIICPNTSINLIANNGFLNPQLKYEWFVGGDLVSEVQSPLFFVDQAKDFRLKVTDAFGCISEDQVSVQTSIGEPDIHISYSDCSGSSVEVSVSGFESVSWQPAAYFNCPLCSSTTISNPDPDQVYVFTGIAGGCVVEKEFYLPVKPRPVITGVEYYEICPGMPVEFDLVAYSSDYSYFWEPSNGLSSTSILNPEAVPLETTGYTLSATDASGCVSETDVLVRVVKLPELNFSEQLEVCRGSSLDYGIPRQNASSIEWTPVKGVSNPEGFFVTLSPDVTTTYTVTVSNGNCESSGQLEVKVLDLVDARFNYSYPGLSVSFTPIIKEGLIYIWDFGDGHSLSSSEPEAIHTYSGEGNYIVCLKIEGDCGVYEHCANVKVRAVDSVNCD